MSRRAPRWTMAHCRCSAGTMSHSVDDSGTVVKPRTGLGHTRDKGLRFYLFADELVDAVARVPVIVRGNGLNSREAVLEYLSYEPKMSF